MKFFSPEDWKRGVALVILWAYAYALVIWPMAFWFSTVITVLTGHQFPSPPLVPWEQLLSGTGTLAAVGGIETWREKNRAATVTP